MTFVLLMVGSVVVFGWFAAIVTLGDRAIDRGSWLWALLAFLLFMLPFATFVALADRNDPPEKMSIGDELK